MPSMRHVNRQTAMWEEVDLHTERWLDVHTRAACELCSRVQSEHIVQLREHWGTEILSARLRTDAAAALPWTDMWDQVTAIPVATVDQRCTCTHDFKLYMEALNVWFDNKKTLEPDRAVERKAWWPKNFCDAPWQDLQWVGSDAMTAMWTISDNRALYPTREMLITVLYDDPTFVACGRAGSCVRLRGLATLADVLRELSWLTEHTLSPDKTCFLGFSGLSVKTQYFHWANKQGGRCVGCGLGQSSIRSKTEVTLAGKSWSGAQSALVISAYVTKLSLMSRLLHTEVELCSNIADEVVEKGLQKAVKRIAVRFFSRADMLALQLQLGFFEEEYESGIEAVKEYSRLMALMYPNVDGRVTKPVRWRVTKPARWRGQIRRTTQQLHRLLSDVTGSSTYWLLGCEDNSTMVIRNEPEITDVFELILESSGYTPDQLAAKENDRVRCTIL